MQYRTYKITKVIRAPEESGKFFSARVQLAGMDKPTELRGFADLADSIKAGARVVASWSDKAKAFFAKRVEGASPQSSAKTARDTSKPASNPVDEIDWNTVCKVIENRSIAAMSAVKASIEYMAGLPEEKKKEVYTTQNMLSLAGKILEFILENGSMKADVLSIIERDVIRKAGSNVEAEDLPADESAEAEAEAEEEVSEDDLPPDE